MLKTQLTKSKTVANKAGATANLLKTKQRLCGTQQDREHKSAGSVWRERM